MPVQKSQRDSSPPLFLTLSLVLVTQNLASNTALSLKLVYYFLSFDDNNIPQVLYPFPRKMSSSCKGYYVPTPGEDIQQGRGRCSSCSDGVLALTDSLEALIGDIQIDPLFTSEIERQEKRRPRTVSIVLYCSGIALPVISTEDLGKASKQKD